MKKMLTLVLILGAASIASASLSISVGGVVDPQGTITVGPSGHLVLDVTAVEQASNIGVYMLVQGPGTMSGGTMLFNGAGGLSGITEYGPNAVIPESDPAMTWGAYFASVGFAGVQNNILFLEFVDTTSPPPALNGKLVDLIDFHCEGLGIVTVTLLNPDTLVAYDTQIIQQIPEPATMLLLSIGGLLLKRRK
jgi:hypothetical protein